MDRDFFVQKVKMICLHKGIKPTNACKESGVGGSFLSDINRGQIPSVAKVQMLADYLGVTTSELLGESPASATPVSEDTIKAAFWGGDKDLSAEDMDAMWADVKNFAAFVAQKKKQEKKRDE